MPRTVSASTPRVRLLVAIHAATLLATALNGGGTLRGAAGALAAGVGLLLVTGATLARIWASAHVAGRKDAELVVDGPYARCRHPLYAASMVAAAGLALATGSLLIGGAQLLAVSLLHVAAVRREDAELALRFGAAHAVWRARVPALLPRAAPGDGPAELRIARPLFRKAFVDAASVYVYYVLLVTGVRLHEAGVLPALLRVP